MLTGKDVGDALVALELRKQSLDRLQVEVAQLEKSVTDARNGYVQAVAHAKLQGKAAPAPPPSLQSNEQQLHTLKASLEHAEKVVLDESTALRDVAVKFYNGLRQGLFERIQQKQHAANKKVAAALVTLSEIVGEAQALRVIDNSMAQGQAIRAAFLEKVPDATALRAGVAVTPTALQSAMTLLADSNVPDTIIEALQNLCTGFNQFETILAKSKEQE